MLTFSGNCYRGICSDFSESSLFVFPHKLILKTCGTTTLLAGISPILELAQKAGFPYGEVYRVFYSRKSFMFPDRQRSPHGSWGEEVQRLNSYFGNICIVNSSL